MKVVGLVSGGKDSCYAMMKCLEYGHEIVALANLMPLDDAVDELDSHMYQTVGHQIVVSYAECMGLPLFRRRIHGSTRHQKLSYRMTRGDEVEDMLILISEVKRQVPSITAVSSGAIASDYQRLRVENVCSRLGLVSLAYLWKQDQSLLLQEMISKGIAAILVKVAALGLDPAKHLGKEIAYMQQHLLRLKELYGSNVCGEGGEYETLTFDCPLFTTARVVLDGFEVVLHSSDSIAPVGVLHPTTFHLEHKIGPTSSCSNKWNGVSNEMGFIFEVQGDFVANSEPNCKSQVLASDFTLPTTSKLHISKTKHNNTFSMGCWVHDPRGTSEGLQKDLATILKAIESELIKDGFGWLNVLYIHLYIANMNDFTLANETYVSFITEEECHLGVPSRSTIELPLLQVGLGRAYVEVLVANDQSKKVLHVQSISCWAPSCIGPYSQAVLHKEILYMAGQLGLDPPTMKLCSGGASAEMEQALENCDAVARSFKCSLASSTILFVVYCSAALASSQKIEIQSKLEAFLEQRSASDLDSNFMCKSFDPMVIYVLAPNLPKSALVEVKPTLYVQEDDKMECKYVINKKICAVTLSINEEHASNICCESLVAMQDHGDCQYIESQKRIKQITRFCIYLLDKILLESYFSWGDITSLRFYFSTCLDMSTDALFIIFTDAFNEFAEISQRIKTGTKPMFNLVPVLGACLISCTYQTDKMPKGKENQVEWQKASTIYMPQGEQLYSAIGTAVFCQSMYTCYRVLIFIINGYQPGQKISANGFDDYSKHRVLVCPLFRLAKRY
ncbi:hypothetical protein IFM89_018672 [Coptis chinensis]|uniref:Diphthine--ammonia ligase n=1 Tax=Coptis chinensis TaxID=261450 RepID=A0A835LVK2_9MAGN|nr:hypothetical protein IFM89_018672 [Coptis chinensis]